MRLFELFAIRFRTVERSLFQTFAARLLPGRTRHGDPTGRSGFERPAKDGRVDVVQLRGGEQRSTGAFEIEIAVSKADFLAQEGRQLLELAFRHLSLHPNGHQWRPVLEARVRHLRGERSSG